MGAPVDSRCRGRTCFVDTHLGRGGGRGLRRRGSRGCGRRGSRGVTRARINRRNRRGGAPGVRDGLLRRFAHRPVPGELRGWALGAPDSDVSLGAGSRVYRGLGGVSVAFDLVSRLMEVRAGVRVVLARLRAGDRVARVDCLAPRQAGSPVQPVGRFRFRDPTPQHDGNLTQNGAEIARLTARRIISRLIASVFSFRRVPSPKRNSQRGAR